MKLTDLINPKAFAQYVATMDLSQEVPSPVLRSYTPELHELAQAFEPSGSHQRAVLSVLIALDMFLQTQTGGAA